jgi:NitT/TauT family transport system substrate-binding protein
MRGMVMFKPRMLPAAVVVMVALILGLDPCYAASSIALPKLKVAKTVRLGFFATVTHAPALIGQEQKYFEKYLTPEGTKIEYVAFNAGPAVIEAIKGGAIDVAYIGPSPTINGYVSTKGSLIRIIGGSTSGGAELVVKPNIDKVSDLIGKKIATPQLGNTQDVALRSWLVEQGLKSSLTNGGDVTVIPTENAQTLTLFQNGDLDGAWLPEPWSSRLVLDAGAKVFLNEKSLWPKGQFVTTHLIASTNFLTSYPGTVRSLLRGHLDAVNFAQTNPTKSQDVVQEMIEKLSGKRLSDAVMSRAWSNLTFTVDPMARTLGKSADNAVEAGVLTTLGSKGLSTIYDLRLLNSLLAFNKFKKVSAAGLGLE